MPSPSGLVGIINRKLTGQKNDWVFKLLRDLGRLVSIESDSFLKIIPRSTAKIIITETFLLPKYQVRSFALSSINDLLNAQTILRVKKEERIVSRSRTELDGTIRIKESKWFFSFYGALHPSVGLRARILSPTSYLFASTSLKLVLEPLWKRTEVPKGTMTAVPPPIRQDIKRKNLPLIPVQHRLEPDQKQIV